MHSLKNIMMVVVEAMINKFEEDETRSQDRQRRQQKEERGSRCTDNCSDSDSSLNQVGSSFPSLVLKQSLIITSLYVCFLIFFCSPILRFRKSKT